jgi:hypothetical protein
MNVFVYSMRDIKSDFMAPTFDNSRGGGFNSARGAFSGR